MGQRFRITFVTVDINCFLFNSNIKWVLRFFTQKNCFDHPFLFKSYFFPQFESINKNKYINFINHINIFEIEIRKQMIYLYEFCLIDKQFWGKTKQNYEVFFITNTKSVSLYGLLCFLKESIGDIRSNMLRKT